MNPLVEDLITSVLERERGYVNHAADRGGPTNWGITQGTLAAWRGKPVSIAEVKALTQAEARDIYRANYFRGLEGVNDKAVLDLLFDYSANSGPRRSVKALQKVIGVVADGEFGPKSAAALAAVKDHSKLYWPLVCERLDNFLRIIGNDPSQVVFAHGWANRMLEFWQGKYGGVVR